MNRHVHYCIRHFRVLFRVNLMMQLNCHIVKELMLVFELIIVVSSLKHGKLFNEPSRIINMNISMNMKKFSPTTLWLFGFMLISTFNIFFLSKSVFKLRSFNGLMTQFFGPSSNTLQLVHLDYNIQTDRD